MYERKVCPECGTVNAGMQNSCIFCQNNLTDINPQDTEQLGETIHIGDILTEEQGRQLGIQINHPLPPEISPAHIMGNRDLSAKELIPFMEQVMVPALISDEMLLERIFEVASAMGIRDSIVFGRGVISTGGLFSRKVADCLAFKNWNHFGGYYGYCITQTVTGGSTVFNIYNFGQSKQMSKEAYLQNTRAFTGNGARTAVMGAFRGGATGVGFAVGGMVGGAIGGSARLIKKGITALTMDKAGLEEEKAWYAMMNMLFQQVFFGE